MTIIPFNVGTSISAFSIRSNFSCLSILFMDRKAFLRNALLGAAGAAASGRLSAERKNQSTAERGALEQVGYNHLPNQEHTTMKTVYHPAESRGHANHGWLDTHHTFSFANYRNPERMHFGALRVLNDDVVSGGRGFGSHPHDNMEIVSIPLEGDLEHKDSMGNTAVIRQGDVQVMSAGTGVYHSEKNRNHGEAVKFLQIWMFPNKKNVEPRYDQIAVKEKDNSFVQILSPTPDDAGVWAHQDAWWYMGNFTSGHTESYSVKKAGNGVYIFVLEGSLTVENQRLKPRDGFGVWDTGTLAITADSDARVLVMDVPMTI